MNKPVGLTYLVKTTAELTAGEVAGITGLFGRVFHKAFPEDILRRKYRSDSFHSLMFQDSELVGVFTAIPVRFHYFGETRVFAATADLMIDPLHRGITNYLKLAAGLHERLAREGVALIFCCLREQMAVFHEKASRWRRIGQVQYYAALMFPLAGFGGGNSLDATDGFPIAKIDDQAFTDYRYSIFPSPYRNGTLEGGGTYVYATEFYYPIEGLPRWIRLGLLLDVSPLTRAHFDLAVAAIRRRERRLHVLVYQGSLPFRPAGMFCVPDRLVKQKWFLSGRILRKDLVDDRVFEMRNWNINLSNGDLV